MFYHNARQSNFTEIGLGLLFPEVPISITNVFMFTLNCINLNPVSVFRVVIFHDVTNSAMFDIHRTLATMQYMSRSYLATDDVSSSITHPYLAEQLGSSLGYRLNETYLTHVILHSNVVNFLVVLVYVFKIKFDCVLNYILNM